MNEIIEQDSRYPEWLKAWNAKAAEIDEQIINFFSGGKDRTDVQNSNGVNTHLASWWDKQDLDSTTRSQYEAARKDEYFNTRVQNRVRDLEKEGKFNQTEDATGR